ncbi:hypothetical protein PHYSODRAFT_490302 [Phytophthora sojae]|uniref:RING-type domain-containing protein n=1 Tax=Phytophthora sojae (strain P6497) TaxID=1094619 RepID=G4Z4S6_PHYSP|nr:hypothetical protein PHYSODRAFT_490302 [Phytophthora sojae]EGZ21613.1 hypothetical protein PHYSODRAFT_490302 [Phytophthora sojae]|eukprot:XP_009524330.1 hypothetical protein PHYSODRAFT_490302 [Phytophthora sojae]
MCGTWSLRGKPKAPDTVSNPLERRLSDTRTCVSCLGVGCPPGTPIHGWPVLLVVSCGHVFCKSCVAKRCSMGVRDRSMVPAHCCGLEFPIEYVKDALEPSGFETYTRFLSEREWQSTSLRSDVEYAKMVKLLGGMQCPRCGVGVLKLSGCEHMRCFCGTNFTYRGR